MILEYNITLIHTSINQLPQPLLHVFNFTEPNFIYDSTSMHNFQNFRIYIHAPQIFMNRLKTRYSTNPNNGTLIRKIVPQVMLTSLQDIIAPHSPSHHIHSHTTMHNIHRV